MTRPGCGGMEIAMRCDDCRFAEWKRTSNGRLHPDKSGRCKRLEQHPLDLRLPSAFWWMSNHLPSPNGGWIERGRDLPEKCIFKDGSRPDE